MLLHDRAEIADGTARITRDGYLVADALVARANNIQEYLAGELGLTDRAPDARVLIFRPEAEVFAKDAMSSLAHRPITLDHPPQGVDANSWKRLAVGDVGGEIVRDGEFVRVPIKIMDAQAVDSVRRDRREFSLGYSASLDMTPGVHDGKPFDGVMKSLRYNHLAAVRDARGGPELRIIDERSPHQNKETPAMAGTVIVDGLPVSLADEAAVRAVLDKKDAAIKAAEKAVADAQAATSTLTGEKAALEKALADEKVKTEPAALDKLVADRSALVAKAKAVKADIVTDGKTDADIRRAVVESTLGDAAKGMDDAAIAGAFAVVAKDAKPAEQIVVSLTPKAAPMNDAKAALSALRAARYA